MNPRSDTAAFATGYEETVVVRAHDVVKRWGTTTALAGVSVTIGAGVTGLLGANGAGKTTLLGLLLGLHHQDAGSIEVLGLDPSRLGPEVRARVGYAPEHHMVPPDVRAHDFVRHLAEIHGIPHREATGRASDVLWQVGLGEERFRPLGTMSTGQRQRVKLAQAIVHDPSVVLLDEPTDGLDPVQREQVLALIKRIGHEFGIHVILSSHLLDEVERICDGVVILDQGTVVASGGLDELRGGARGVVVELDEGVEEVADALRAAKLRIEVDGRRITVSGGDEVFDFVRDAIDLSGASVRRLHPGRLSLEDVFLAAPHGGRP